MSAIDRQQGDPMTDRASFPLDTLALDRGAAMPMHRQIYDLLRRKIIGRSLRPGTRLPASRALARQLGVGRNTVIAAYDQLLAEGYVETRSGAGTWVAELVTHEAPQSSPHQEPRLPALSRRGRLMTARPRYRTVPGQPAFHPGFPDIAGFPFSTWARLLKAHARHPREDLFGYHYIAGHPRLRAAIAAYLGASREVQCDPEQVIVTTGAQAGLDLLARLLLDEGDVAWVEDPGYAGARNAFSAAGARLVPLPVSRQGWSIADDGRPPPRLIYLTPSCQMPLGVIMRLEERLQMLQLADHHDAWIIEDDYDGEYRFRGRPVAALQGLDRARRVIYLGTFAKTLFPALRLGFMVVPRPLVEGLKCALAWSGQFAPLLLQRALADFVEGGHFSRHLNRTRRLYAKRQREFVACCRRHLGRWLAIDECDAGIQLIGRFLMPFDDREVAAEALRRGVDVEPLSESYRGVTAEHGLRFGYAAVPPAEMLRGIMALQATFRELEQRAAVPSHRPEPALPMEPLAG